MAKKVFKEKQNFRNLEIIGAGVLIIALVLQKFVRELFLAQNEAYFEELTCIVLVVAIGACLWYALRFKLATTITKNGIRFKMVPIHSQKRKINWEEIESCQIEKTPVNAQYHGANITFNREKFFSFSGRNGVRVKTKDGRCYFIGSRKPDELKNAIEKSIPTKD